MLNVFARTAGVIYGASMAEIFAPTKTSAAATKARQLTWALAHSEGMTKAEIARQTGRCWRTVDHGIRVIRREWRELEVPNWKAKRNAEILRRKAEGKSHRQIAREMGIGLGVVAGVITRSKGKN